MLVFVLVPLAEILVIVQIGGAIGGWWTAALLVADSLLGAYLLRVEGRRAWSEFRSALEEGRWPGDEVAQGALVIVGGTLLLTPGFLTDVLGFLFLLGPTRRMVARRLRARVAETTGSGTSPPSGTGRRAPGAGGRRRRSPGADGERPQGGGGRRGPGPRVRTPDGDEVVLDVEVVEIRREQGRLDAGEGHEQPARDEPQDEVEDDGPGAGTDDQGRV